MRGSSHGGRIAAASSSPPLERTLSHTRCPVANQDTVANEVTNQHSIADQDSVTDQSSVRNESVADKNAIALIHRPVVVRFEKAKRNYEFRVERTQKTGARTIRD